MESSSLQQLQQIPGVGITIARDMQNIGIHSIDDLKGRQAQRDTSHQRRATLKLIRFEGTVGLSNQLLTCRKKQPKQRLNWKIKPYETLKKHGAKDLKL